MKAAEILVVTRSVVLQQELGALLESLPEVASVKAVRDISAAYKQIEERQPQIVLLDEDLLAKYQKDALEKIRSVSPLTIQVLLANDIQQVSLLLTHAEAVLIKGIQLSAIASTISNLLSTKEEEHEHNDSNSN